MNWARAAFYLVLAVCAVVLTIDAHRNSLSLDRALAGVGAIEKNSADLLAATYATEASLANLADSLNGIAADLHEHESAELTQAQAASEKLTQVFTDADAAVVRASAAIDQTNRAIAGIAADAHKTLGAGQETLGAATADLSDPSLRAGLAEFGSSAANAAAATKDAAGAMADVHRVTSYEAKQIMAPVSKAKAIALVATRFVGKFFGF